jgi:hypothetical protein
MNRRLIIFLIVSIILIAAGIFIYSNLEIYKRETEIFPSREAIANNYLALERWLSETGHPVRIEKRAEISRIVSAPEKTVVVHASSCEWKDTPALLVPWMERGGFLVIILDSAFFDDELAQFLASFGIVKDNQSQKKDQDNESVEEIPEEENLEEIINKFMLGEIEDDENISTSEKSNFCDFDWNIRFSVTEGKDVAVLKDSDGIIRLAQISLGDGGLAVTGKPYFMFNDYLKRDVNAALAWDLTGARALDDNPGIIFLRSKRSAKSFFGKIADHGNISPLFISVFILIITGFWMVIPVFGPVFGEKQSRARPIRERFLAEACFLKKYGALTAYLELYLREIKRRAEKTVPASTAMINGDDEIAAIEKAMQQGMKNRDIIKSLRRLQKKLEC